MPRLFQASVRRPEKAIAIPSDSTLIASDNDESDSPSLVHPFLSHYYRTKEQSIHHYWSRSNLAMSGAVDTIGYGMWPALIWKSLKYAWSPSYRQDIYEDLTEYVVVSLPFSEDSGS
jgi:hypothetical protein